MLEKILVIIVLYLWRNSPSEWLLPNCWEKSTLAKHFFTFTYLTLDFFSRKTFLSLTVFNLRLKISSRRSFCFHLIFKMLIKLKRTIFYILLFCIYFDRTLMKTYSYNHNIDHSLFFLHKNVHKSSFPMSDNRWIINVMLEIYYYYKVVFCRF